MTGRWYMGLDLGRITDPSALALVEPWRGKWALSHLRTWRPVREDMTDTLDVVLHLVDRHRPAVRPGLGIDARGVGRAVALVAIEGETAEHVDVYPLLPSFSDRDHRQRPDGFVWIGKNRLVDRLREAVALGELVVSPSLPEARDFQRELLELVERPTERGVGTTWTHPSRAARHHDDRVQAVAYALFLAVTLTRQGFSNRISPANRRRESA